MSRKTNLATIERDRNLRTERREKAKVEANALELRRAETLTLASIRGEEIDDPPIKRGERTKPMRRMSGLMWLKSKAKLTDDQYAAGMRYGACYRMAKGEAAIKSILNDDIKGGDGPDIMRAAEKAAQARCKLQAYRGQLNHSNALVRACDAVCGEEWTPRECSADGHAAGRLEAVLLVALDMLAGEAGSTAYGDEKKG